MSHDLLTQLAEYGTYCDERQGTVTADDVTDAVMPLPMPTQPTRPRHGWLIAVAAVVLVFLVAGGLALLGPFGGEGVAPVNEPAVTTIPAPTTVPATTIPAPEPVVTTAVPQTTLPVAPVIPPGEGPKLEFVQADEAPDVDLSEGAWFNGAMYALGEDRDSSGRTLHRSTDGLTWEVVSGLPASVGHAWHSMLQTDGDLLVNVVMPEQGTSIEVFTSPNGDDWTSTTIQPPIPIASNMAGEFRVLDASGRSSGSLAVGPKGIVLAATVTLDFEGEGFANTLVNSDSDEEIHVEVVDLDLDRGVMIVKFLDENDDMTQIGELEEIDLNSAGFSGAFSNLLDAMATDPDWSPKIEGFIAQLTDVYTTGSADASVGYAWHSPDGINWQRIETAGPLDGGKIAATLATPDGFMATASSLHSTSFLPSELRYLAAGFDRTVVWQSTDGTTWSEAPGFTSRHGFDDSQLAEWQGNIIEHVGSARRRENDTNVWTLADPPRAVFDDVSTQGMILEVTRLGLMGTPTYGWEEPGKIEILFSPDGASWNRWEPPEIVQDTTGTEVWLVGAGSDFVVVQAHEWNEVSQEPSRSLWVGRLP